MIRFQSAMALALLVLTTGCGGGSETAESAEGAGRSATVPEIASGTQLVFTVDETVSTQDHSKGHEFSLRLANAVASGRGDELPAGTRARGVVTSARSSTDSDEPAELVIALSSLEIGGQMIPIKNTVVATGVTADAGDSGALSAAKVGTGAAAGAIVGQVLGGDTRSTVAGAVVGTVAGAGVAAATRAGHAALPAGSTVTIRLDEALPVR